MPAKSRLGRTRRARSTAAPGLLLPPRKSAIPHYRSAPSSAAYFAIVFKPGVLSRLRGVQGQISQRAGPRTATRFWSSSETIGVAR